MQIRDPKAYETWKKNNSDGYGSAIFRYAERWANLMEEGLEKGESLENIAASTSHEADTEKITGFMQNCAVSTLVASWKYGEELRQWHNRTHLPGGEREQANQAGRIVNSALLSIR